MQFRAKLRRGTAIYRNWAARRQARGEISGVPFVLSGMDYVSEDDPLSADAVAAIKDHLMVVLILTAHTSSAAEPEPEPEPKASEPFEPPEPAQTPAWKSYKPTGPVKRR